MNLISGRIEEIFVHEGITIGKISVRGAFMKVPLIFLTEARVGDTIVIESGVAISKTEDKSSTATDGGEYVPGNSRQSSEH
jgi:hydrogenase maturation factor